MGEPLIRLVVGTPVQKHTGYSFPGEIRAAFTNKDGELLYVVEATVAPYEGMLHIFRPNQLVVTQGVAAPLPTNPNSGI